MFKGVQVTTKIGLVFLSAIKYSSWCAFFVFQGKAIQQAIDKSMVLDQLAYTLCWFFLTKLLVMASDVWSHFVIDYFENKALEQQWRSTFPRMLFRDNEHKNNLMYLMYFDYLPELYRLECNIVTNQCTMISVLVIVLFSLIHSGFYYGAAGLFVVFILSFINKKLFLNTLDEQHKELHERKEQVLVWINQFFRAYKEIAFNWVGQAEQWINSIYLPVYESKKRLIKTQLKRDMVSQCLVEIPFLLNTMVVLLAVYVNHLSMTQLFVWVGFSQFVINATHSFLENKVNRAKKQILIEKVNEISAVFHVPTAPCLVLMNKDEQLIDTIPIKLQDDTINHLSMNPVIHHIRGANGAGKSTLLNLMIGYERHIQMDNHPLLLRFIHTHSMSNIRVIERNPEFFSMFSSFNEQILGPERAQSGHWAQLLDEKTSKVLSRSLIDELVCFFHAMEEQYAQRVLGCFSSGEKILMSLLRALTSWSSTISMLVSDECIAFLDPKAKHLLVRCLDELSEGIPVFISSHEALYPECF